MSRKIVFSIGDVSDNFNGPSQSVFQTTRELANREYRQCVVGTSRPNNIHSVNELGVKTIGLKRLGPYSLHYGRNLKSCLKEIGTWDLLSIQGPWLYINRGLVKASLERKSPILLTAHGNFNEVALKKSNIKKIASKLTFLREMFNVVDCYQALSEIECLALRRFGITKPICVVPNGVDLVSSKKGAHKTIRSCLYLGRLDPIKGIEDLLTTWGKIDTSGWKLTIAGSGELKYVQSLKAMAAANSSLNIEFLGSVYGDEKVNVLANADLFVLPSKSEGLAMAPLEAFSHSTPALLSEACGFPNAEEEGAACIVDLFSNELDTKLQKMLYLSNSELERMGKNGRSMVETSYTWPIVCDQLELVYSWLNGDASSPSCVHLD